MAGTGSFLRRYHFFGGKMEPTPCSYFHISAVSIMNVSGILQYIVVSLNRRVLV